MRRAQKDAPRRAGRAGDADADGDKFPALDARAQISDRRPHEPERDPLVARRVERGLHEQATADGDGAGVAVSDAQAEADAIHPVREFETGRGPPHARLGWGGSRLGLAQESLGQQGAYDVGHRASVDAEPARDVGARDGLRGPHEPQQRERHVVVTDGRHGLPCRDDAAASPLRLPISLRTRRI